METISNKVTLKKKPVVSIVCLTFNAEQFIDDLLNSVFSQDIISDCELIISDDGSIDSTVEKIQRSFSKCKCSFRLIKRNKNVGAEENWLYALSQANSDYIAYIDGDDYLINNDKLSSDIKILKDNPDAGMVFGPAFIKIGTNLQKNPRNVYKNWDDKKINIFWVMKNGGGFFPTSSVVFKSSLLKNLPDNFWRTHVTGDLPLAVACLWHEKSILYKNKIDVVYRVHDESRTNSVHSVFQSYRRNLRKLNRNKMFIGLVFKNKKLSKAQYRDLLYKEEYIFLSKLVDLFVFKYSFNMAIQKLNFYYFCRLSLKIIYRFVQNLLKK